MELPEWVWQVLHLVLTAVAAFTLNAISKRQEQKLFEQRNENPGMQVYKVKPMVKYLGFFFLALGLLGSYFLSSSDFVWLYMTMFFLITLLGLWLIGLAFTAKVTVTTHVVTSYGIFENKSMHLEGFLKEKKLFFTETVVLQNKRGEKVMIADSIANREYLISVIHARSAANTRASTHPLSANQQKIAKRSH